MLFFPLYTYLDKTIYIHGYSNSQFDIKVHAQFGFNSAPDFDHGKTDSRLMERSIPQLVTM
jgi:hypothetical protein